MKYLHDILEVWDSRSQKTPHGDIFVYVVPVYSNALTNQPPFRALNWSSFKQSRKPGQRGRDSPSIGKCDDKLICRADYIDSVGERLTG
ncbi:MAG: hypothetical protein V7609_219 [Verrucomicrobiota bacterium]